MPARAAAARDADRDRHDRVPFEGRPALEHRLDPAHFFRVHRSAIVNLERITELQPLFKGEQIVLLQDGTRLKLSKSRRADLEARLGQSI